MLATIPDTEMSVFDERDEMEPSFLTTRDCRDSKACDCPLTLLSTVVMDCALVFPVAVMLLIDVSREGDPNENVISLSARCKMNGVRSAKYQEIVRWC